jgi:hypothetical protein
MQAYIITATDQFCGYKDAFKVTAESAKDAIAKWSKLQGKLGINVEYRWPNPVACKAEHFKPQFIYQDNMPVNMRHSGIEGDGGSEYNHEVVQWSDLTKAEKEDVLEWLAMEKETKDDELTPF